MSKIEGILDFELPFFVVPNRTPTPGTRILFFFLFQDDLIIRGRRGREGGDCDGRGPTEVEEGA